MACGTGKTFTALRIAEAMAPTGGTCLFLVPSHVFAFADACAKVEPAWSTNPIAQLLAVLPDAQASASGKHTKRRGRQSRPHDIRSARFQHTNVGASDYPAISSALKKLAKLKKENAAADDRCLFDLPIHRRGFAEAQQAGLPEFDLIICDEAHRTTGVTLTGEDESQFVKVHDAKFLKGRKRIYMTATPRIYGDEAKTKAKQAAAELASMDDPALFGAELHRLGFGEAVGKSLLSDYKVLVLAVDEKYVSKTFQKQIADKNTELNLDDAVKITGCWNGLAKRLDRATSTETDLQGQCAHAPRRRLFALHQGLQSLRREIRRDPRRLQAPRIPMKKICSIATLTMWTAHFEAIRRNALLDWLKADAPENTCRILSNARCLSEGVDVPALDAVLFLNPRNSVIDVVQSVGRVMRTAVSQGKPLRLHHPPRRHPRRHHARRSPQGQRKVQSRLASPASPPCP